MLSIISKLERLDNGLVVGTGAMIQLGMGVRLLVGLGPKTGGGGALATKRPKLSLFCSLSFTIASIAICRWFTSTRVVCSWIPYTSAENSLTYMLKTLFRNIVEFEALSSPDGYSLPDDDQRCQ